VGSSELPIYSVAGAVVAGLRENFRLVLQAPTGSGKSTQIPQILLDEGVAGQGQVIVLQPRRVAARLLARRVAAERSVKLGEEVGYHVRLDRVAGPATRILFVTEGVLLRRMIDDHELRGVSIVILDEFHERHLDGDVSLGRALQIQQSRRPDLKIIVMSATLETSVLEEFLAPAVTVRAEGRTFPVEIQYLPKPTDEPVWEVAARQAARLVAGGAEGDALVFMPGAYEIHRTLRALEAEPACRDFLLLPLHGELPAAAQDAAVEPAQRRKIIVSTNVAETSLTIDGVRWVIDSGLARIPRFDPHRGINTLLVDKISRASAEQRAGRAGRTASGKCLRLWTEREHQARAAHELPEVRRLDLSDVLLRLKAAGVDDLAAFPWVERPDPRSFERALVLLHDLGAFDHGEKLTGIGRRMAAFPMHPRYARMLIAAGETGCVRPIALIAALTQGRPILQRAEGKQVTELRDDLFGGETTSDSLILIRAWNWARGKDFSVEACRRIGVHAGAAREAAALFEQFLDIARAQGLPTDTGGSRSDDAAIRRCLLAGFADQVAMRLDGGTLRCGLVHGRRGTLARESVVRDARLLVAGEVREVQTRGDEVSVLLTMATVIEEDWLREMFPDDFTEEASTVFDPGTRRVVARREKRFRDLVLESRQAGEPNADDAARLLAAEVIAGRASLGEWNHDVDQWFERAACLREWRPELEVPAIGAEDRASMIEQICHGAFGVKELKDRPVWPTLRAWFPGHVQGALDNLAPERLALPGGRRAKLTYRAGSAPVLAARIQDLYGVTGQLFVGGGRIPVLIHVLAPNQRPVQVTDNLDVFWRDTYPKLKQELQRKYPKHAWK
jgi:ATP-dependent helicase HrpB